MSYLQESENEIRTIEEFLTILSNINHLEWGDFFLFENYPHNWKSTKEMKYPQLISQTDTTYRVVDDEYFYIYTKKKDLIENIIIEYEVETIQVDNIHNLPFPS